MKKIRYPRIVTKSGPVRVSSVLHGTRTKIVAILLAATAASTLGFGVRWLEGDASFPAADSTRIAHAAIKEKPPAAADLPLTAGGTPCLSDSDPPAGTECASDGIEFVWVPPGSFIMGGRMSPEQVSAKYGWPEPNTFRGEHPMHKVTFTHGFWLGKYEVTNIEFARFVEATGYRTDSEKEGWGLGTKGLSLGWRKIEGIDWRKPGWDIAPDQPVVLISWNDATAFCEWIAETTGKRYRLPTDAEWEYAGRAGTDTEYPWGDDVEGGFGWLNAADETSRWGRTFASHFPFSDGYLFVARVGRFFPNAWGLHDMNGNVWEWCQDWYSSLPTGSVTDPGGPSNGSGHIIRGGGWHAVPAFCRTSTRFSDPPDHRHANMGFRIARNP